MLLNVCIPIVEIFVMAKKSPFHAARCTHMVDHLCGGDLSANAAYADGTPSSPRMRGRSAPANAVLACSKVFPAHARVI